MVDVLELVREKILPERGAEFELAYHAGEEELPKEKWLAEPHTHVSAVSPGLKVLAYSADAKIRQRRQVKPWAAGGLQHRTMLVVELNGTFVHILGSLVVVAERRMNVGEITSDPEE